jgi:hypothetical protein
MTGVFVKMHTADPGAGGTANAAANATRKQLSVGDELTLVGGFKNWRLTQDAVIAYTGGEVTTTESYAWVSYWTAVTGGTWLGNEDIPNQAATATNALNIAAGVIVVTNRAVIDYIIRTQLAVNRVNDRRNRSQVGSFLANAAAAQHDKFALQPPQKI